MQFHGDKENIWLVFYLLIENPSQKWNMVHLWYFYILVSKLPYSKVWNSFKALGTLDIHYDFFRWSCLLKVRLNIVVSLRHFLKQLKKRFFTPLQREKYQFFFFKNLYNVANVMWCLSMLNKCECYLIQVLLWDCLLFESWWS